MSTEFMHLLEQSPHSHITWAKLTIPQQSSTHLKRNRLVDKIHNMIDRKLVLVRAHAGYGKTSFLVELAHETDLQVCWYTIEEGDSDLGIFLTYLVASIARRFPSFGQRSLRLLQNSGNQIHSQLRVFAATLADEILAIPEYFFLILDDYHTLAEDSHVHEFIRFLLDFSPEQCHLIISSRTVPPLPLIRLVARQQMTAIGIDDLRFTEQELQDLADEQLDITLPTEQARSLLQQTDGWITAIWLSADMGWDDFLQGSASLVSELTETGIYDYLMNEVFACQPAEVQEFLLCTSVLKELSIALCSELLGKDSRDMLRTLEKNSLFILRLEETGIETTYRYHPLFHSFLLNRLQEQHASLYRDLNVKAAELFAAEANWQACVFYNLNAGRFVQARQTILLHFDELNLGGLRESVARWIDALPPEHISPELQLKRAMLAADLGQIDTALRLYTNVIVLFESMERRSDLALALIERSLALSKTSRHTDAIQDCQQALLLLEGDEDADSLRGRAYRYLGRFHGETGDPTTALHFLTMAYECWEKCGESPVRMARLAQDIGVVYELQGQFSAAIMHYAKAQSEWTRIGNDGEIAYALNGIGVAHHRLGEYQTALQVLHEALQKGQLAGSMRAEAYTLASLGDLYRDLGQCEQASTFYDQALEKALAIGENYLRTYIANAKMETLYVAGQVDKAQREIEHALSTGSLSKFYEARYRLLFAATLIAQRKQERAKQELDAILFQSGGQGDLAFRGHIQLARVAMLENQLHQTSAHLHTAFELAQEAGLTQALCVESLNHIQVLRFATKGGIKSQELDRWIAKAQELDQLRKSLSEIEQQVTDGSHTPELVITALGSSHVLLDGEPVSWRTTQAKELFFYLLTHTNGQTKEQIGAEIWPDHSKAKLFSIFRSSLFRVRKALYPDAILFKDDLYSLNPGIPFKYDVTEFEQEISRGELADNPVQSAYHYRRAIELYQGPFLSDLYADWISIARETLQTRYLEALTFLAKFNLERGRYHRTIEFARQILAVDEYYEVAYYLLIKAYARSGQRPQARRVYTQCQDMLAEFGLSPQNRWEELCR